MRNQKRHPRGVPVGGQFAAHLAASASTLLVEDTDPWADLDDDVTPEPPPADEPEPEPEPLRPEPHPEPAEPVIGMGLEAERQLIADLNVAMGYAPRETAEYERYLDIRARLEAEYGTHEQALLAVGRSVLARAEHAAGITAEDVRTSWVERSEASHGRMEQLSAAVKSAADAQAITDLYNAAQHDTATHLALRTATDEETKAGMRRLADGYVAALSELRDLGGQMDWHAKTKKDAQALFDEAASIYPADWITASNARRTNREGYPIGKAYARISKSRAHYSEGNYAATRKKVARQTYSKPAGAQAAALENYGRSANPYFEFRELTEVERQREYYNTHVVTRYEVSHSLKMPKGPRWEQWVDPRDETTTYWRRPQMRMETVESESAPELTTNLDTSRVEGRPRGFAIAAHELAHRFERAVPDLQRLENDFLVRRTTDEAGNREPLTRLYRGRREFAYKDNFPTAYMGKVYDHGSREIMSMGVEAMFGGNHGGLVGVGAYSGDDEYRAFVLGAMATLGQPGSER